MAALKAFVDDDKVWARAAAVAVVVLGLVDLWHFHALPQWQYVDTALIAAGLSTFGIHWPTATA